MTVEIVKHTGTFETIQVEQMQEDGTTKIVDQESEILEVAQSMDFEEADKPTVTNAAHLRAQMLTRDTGYTHAVRFI